MEEIGDRQLYSTVQKITRDFKYSDVYNYLASDSITLSNVENIYKTLGWQQFINDAVLERQKRKAKKSKLKINFEGD